MGGPSGVTGQASSHVWAERFRLGSLLANLRGWGWVVQQSIRWSGATIDVLYVSVVAARTHALWPEVNRLAEAI